MINKKQWKHFQARKAVLSLGESILTITRIDPIWYYRNPYLQISNPALAIRVKNAIDKRKAQNEI